MRLDRVTEKRFSRSRLNGLAEPLVLTNDFIASFATEAAPDGGVHVVADELHDTIAQQEMRTAWMKAPSSEVSAINAGASYTVSA